MLFSSKMIIALVSLVVVLGGGAYVAHKNVFRAGPAANDKMVDMRADEEADALSEMTGTSSLSTLLAFDKDLQCVFAYTPEEGGHAEGTVYISGKQVRGDFRVGVGDGDMMETHMIRSEQVGYVWGTSSTGEIATTFQLRDGEDPIQAGVNLDESETVGYECEPWNVDSTKFTPPSGIQFNDASAEMQMMMH